MLMCWISTADSNTSCNVTSSNDKVPNSTGGSTGADLNGNALRDAGGVKAPWEMVVGIDGLWQQDQPLGDGLLRRFSRRGDQLWPGEQERHALVVLHCRSCLHPCWDWHSYWIACSPQHRFFNQFKAKTKHDLFLQHFMQGIFGKLSPTKIYKFLEKFQTTFDPLLFGKTLQKFAVFSWPNIDRTHYVENLPGEFLIWRMTFPPPLFETFPKNHPFWWGITSINPQ